MANGVAGFGHGPRLSLSGRTVPVHSRGVRA